MLNKQFLNNCLCIRGSNTPFINQESFGWKDRNITQFKGKRKIVDAQEKLLALKDQFWGSGQSALISHPCLTPLVSAKMPLRAPEWPPPSSTSSSKIKFWTGPYNLPSPLSQPWVRQNSRAPEFSILKNIFFPHLYSKDRICKTCSTFSNGRISKVKGQLVPKVVRLQWLLDKEISRRFLVLADIHSLFQYVHPNLLARTIWHWHLPFLKLPVT